MEATLISAARTGDEQAFEALYERYDGRVRRMMGSWFGDPDLVDDLCQEIWLRAYQGIGQFRGDSGFGTWLHRIARNVATSRGRSARRRAELMVEWWNPELSTGPEPVHLRLALQRAVATLPSGMRQVLWLHDVEGLTHNEIGGALGMAEGTSKSQLSKARARLRDRLRDRLGRGSARAA